MRAALEALQKSDYVSVRNKTIKPSLALTYLGPFKVLSKSDRTSYLGPFKVLSKSDRTFSLDMGHRTNFVSIDCLKPAFRVRVILPTYKDKFACFGLKI
uniref:Uncharacterized protein n=1 Tax=Lepeophtheirus salmonis TaxID=72036 RepID=A0A0K2V8Z0_LEPSM